MTMPNSLYVRVSKAKDWDRMERSAYHVIKNRLVACLKILSLAHWLSYAHCDGANERNSLAGWNSHPPGVGASLKLE